MEFELTASKKQTEDAFKSRAVLYRYFYEEFSKEFGDTKTAVIMKRAIYRWGGSKTHKYLSYAENGDFKGLAEEFVKSSVCGGDLFKPSIEKCAEGTAILDMSRCPLVEAWQDMGLSAEEVAKMCDIANATDYGKYEGMGFDLTIDSTIAEGKERCRLVIKDKKKDK